MKYRRIVKAVARAELSLWPVVDALVAELKASPKGVVASGEYDRITRTLSENGFRSWSARRLQGLHSIGQWLQSARQRVEIREFPVEWVIEARKAARSDHDKALEILRAARSKRDIRPDKVRVTAPQVIEALEDVDFVEEILDDPRGIATLTRALTGRPGSSLSREVLPDAPRVGSLFWQAVQAIDGLHSQFEQFGLQELELEPEAHEAIFRTTRKLAEIAAAFAEAAVESRLNAEA